MKKTNAKFTLALTPGEMLYGWVYLLAELLLLPTAIYGLGDMLGIRSTATVNFLYYLCNFCACVWIFRPLLSQSLTRAGQQPGELVSTAIVGFLLYWGANYLMSLAIVAVAPDFSNVNDNAISEMFTQHPLLMALGTVILAPVAEECLYRGLIFVPAARKNLRAGYALSILAFCAIHVVGYVGVYPAATLFMCFLQYIPAGAVLAWACRKADSLFAPILIHAAINLVSVVALR